MRTAPAVDAAGHILLATQGRLVALVEEHGAAKVIWDYAIGCHVPGRITVADDGTIRAHAADGLLHCVDPHGKPVFAPVQVGRPLGWAAPLVDAEGNTWISHYTGGLIRVDPGGKLAGSVYFRSRCKLDCAGILVHRVLCIGSEDPYVLAIDLSGTCGVNRWAGRADLGLVGSCVNSALALAEDGTLLVAVRDQKLVGLSPEGVVAWVAPLPGQLLGSPVIDRHGHIYVGVSRAERGAPGRGMLVCVDGHSHRVRWQYDVEAPVESTPVIGSDDTLYFGDNAGTIYALSLQGTLQWSARVEAPVRSAGTIPAPHRLAFGLDDDTLVVLECSSQGLASQGWPKIGGTLGQSGQAQRPGTTA